MVSPSGRWLGGLVLAGALFPSGVRAQTTAHSFDELQRYQRTLVCPYLGGDGRSGKRGWCGHRPIGEQG